MNKEIQLSTTDHITVAIHALFIFLSLKASFISLTISLIVRGFTLQNNKNYA